MSSKKHERPEASEHAAVDQASSAAPETAQPAGAGTQPAAGSPASPSEADAPALAALRARLASAEVSVKTLTEENGSLKDQYLRKLADYENFRKRMFREKEEAQKYAVSGLLVDLVQTLDDFDRAIASAEHARDYQMLHDGIALIRRQLGSLLENKYGLARFESLGKPFDPNCHEAVATVPGEGGESEPMIAEEYLPGYRLHDRIVRSAKVRVRMPAPTSSPAQASDRSVPHNDGEAQPADAAPGASA